MVDWTYMMFFSLFATVFAMSVGLFEFSADSDAEDEDAGPEFEPENYTDLFIGTPGDDAMTAQNYEADLAYMLAEGSDTLVASEGDDLADGGAGNDVLILSNGDDMALGGDGEDVLSGGAGDDELHGQGGDDDIEGNGGDDLLYGGSGDDLLDGGQGDDILFGGLGDDVLILGEGDLATGGEGMDEFHVYEIDSPEAPPADITDFAAGTDAIHVHYYPVTDPETGAPAMPEIDVSFDDEADATVVTLNGQQIATLAGDAGITVADVVLTPIG